MAKKAQTQTGERAIRAIFADATLKKDGQALGQSADPNLPRDGMKPGEWNDGRIDEKMPDAIGVQVVGRDAEGMVYCITMTGHLRRMEKYDMQALTDLFAPDTNTLKFFWPGWGKKKVWDEDKEQMVEKQVVNRVERDKAMMAIINTAATRDFDPQKQHRGTGGWEDTHGAFIWHAGDYMWTVDGPRLHHARPAQHAGYLYTRQAATIHPWQEAVKEEESPAHRILQHLSTWNWQRPHLDPILVLGWIATAFMGGALKARPIIFTIGGAGVGKSRLHELVRTALDGVVITSVNTTAAGIYQRVKQDSRPVMVDELENKAGSTRAEAVIELARVAYTGGDISRGGQDHEATTFTARNSFFFSAIIPPRMAAQDRTRMAIVNLNALDRPGHAGSDMKMIPETDGRMILRQVMDGWTDFRDRLLPAYATALGKQGLSARAIDTYGTLLAAAELLVGPAALEAIGLPVTEELHLGELIVDATADERAENLPHWHQVIDTLFQASIDKWSNAEKPTVGGVLENLLIGPAAGGWDARGAQDRLKLVNLSAMDAPKSAQEAGPCLLVPKAGQMLNRIFADTDFHNGGWWEALKQAPPAINLGTKTVKINGSSKKCQMIDLKAFDEYAAKQ